MAQDTSSADGPAIDKDGSAFHALEEKVEALKRSRKASVGPAFRALEEKVRALEKEMAHDTSSADGPAIDKDGSAFHALEEKVEALKRSSKEIPQSTSDETLAVPRQKSKE